MPGITAVQASKFRPSGEVRFLDPEGDGRRRDPADLAREFEPTAQPISHWVAQADRQEGRREEKGAGLAAAERELRPGHDANSRMTPIRSDLPSKPMPGRSGMVM